MSNANESGTKAHLVHGIVFGYNQLTTLHNASRDVFRNLDAPFQDGSRFIPVETAFEIQMHIYVSFTIMLSGQNIITTHFVQYYLNLWLKLQEDRIMHDIQKGFSRVCSFSKDLNPGSQFSWNCQSAISTMMNCKLHPGHLSQNVGARRPD